MVFVKKGLKAHFVIFTIEAVLAIVSSVLSLLSGALKHPSRDHQYYFIYLALGEMFFIMALGGNSTSIH